MNELDIEELTTTELLEGLRPEWTALWRRSAVATPFQSPEWQITWWEQFGHGELWTLALRSEGRLAGLIPLFINQNNPSNLREVSFIGTGISDYLDGLFERDFEEIGAAETIAFLSQRTDFWDVCDLQELPANSRFTEGKVPSDWADQMSVQETCPVLVLPESVENLRDFVPAHQLDNCRYYQRRASKVGKLQLDRADLAHFNEFFESLLYLHKARFQSRGESGVLTNPLVVDFHRKAARELLSEGLLRLYGLRLEERVVAVFYGFAHNRKVYYYLGGFDPEFEYLSLGSLLVGFVIKQSIEEGIRELDFLRGCESYKYLWGSKDRLNYRRRLFAKPELAGKQKITHEHFAPGTTSRR